MKRQLLALSLLATTTFGGDKRINSGEFLENGISRGAGEVHLAQDLAPGEYIVEIVQPFGAGSANYLLDLESE